MTEFDPAVKRSRSNKGNRLNRLYMADATNAAYHVLRLSAIRFLRRFSKLFTIYRRGGHVTWPYEKTLFPHLKEAPDVIYFQSVQALSEENIDDADKDWQRLTTFYPISSHIWFRPQAPRSLYGSSLCLSLLYPLKQGLTNQYNKCNVSVDYRTAGLTRIQIVYVRFTCEILIIL